MRALLTRDRLQLTVVGDIDARPHGTAVLVTEVVGDTGGDSFGVGLAELFYGRQCGGFEELLVEPAQEADRVVVIDHAVDGQPCMLCDPLVPPQARRDLLRDQLAQRARLGLAQRLVAVETEAQAAAPLIEIGEQPSLTADILQIFHWHRKLGVVLRRAGRDAFFDQGADALDQALP